MVMGIYGDGDISKKWGCMGMCDAMAIYRDTPNSNMSQSTVFKGKKQ